MVYKFFNKTFASLADKSASGGIKIENMSNKELAIELHKPIIRKFEKRKVHSSFMDTIWGVGLAHMQLISKSNKGLAFYCVLLVFSVNTHGLFL